MHISTFLDFPKSGEESLLKALAVLRVVSFPIFELLAGLGGYRLGGVGGDGSRFSGRSLNIRKSGNSKSCCSEAVKQ